MFRDVNHGKIEDDFAEFFQNKARGTNYELIYNRYTRDTVDMSFLNQQYAKMSTGQEILSEMYTTKVHENNTQLAPQFQEDILHLRSKIKVSTSNAELGLLCIMYYVSPLSSHSLDAIPTLAQNKRVSTRQCMTTERK